MSPARAVLQMLFEGLLAEEFPRLSNYALVGVEETTDYLFVVQPLTNRVAVQFSVAAARSSSLMDIVHEAGTSAEQLLFGNSVACRHQLDALDWWIFRQHQLPCSD